MQVDEFIERWLGSGGSEMATAQTFALELTELLGVARPNVSDKDGDFLDYRFERPVMLTHTGRKRNGRIDLYKKNHFVLEAKQFVSPDAKDKSTLGQFLEKDGPKQTGHGKRGTSKFDDTMMKARNQADNYARAVAKEDGYQHLADYVRPEREENSVPSLAEVWWRFARPRDDFRPALLHIDRMIVTSLTASNRIFVFASSNTIADSTTVMFALDAGEHLAIISSRPHLTWVSASGGTLEDRPRYNKSRCFDPFPFPDLTDDQKNRLRSLGDELDAHRKRQQAAHSKLTLTQMYNVLEKLRAGKAIEGKDKKIYDQGLVGILRDLHDQIDAAVADAYGWPVDLSDEDILLRLVALNKERAEEEARGHIRWLRPTYQNPTGQQATLGKTADMDLGVVAKIDKAPWPKNLPEQIAAVREALTAMGEATPEQIARRFSRARSTTVAPLLESLAALGQADKGEDGKFAA